MRGFLPAAMALSLAALPLAAQGTHRPRVPEHRARRPTTSASSGPKERPESRARVRLKLWGDGAIVLATRLELKQDSTAEHLHTDANALGRDLDDAESALAELRRRATGAEKTRLDSARTHFKEARKHYDQLRKAEPDVDRVATHAAAVHEHLSAAERVLAARAHPPAPRRTTPPARRKGRARRRSGRP